MDLTRPSSGQDQAEDPTKIQHLEEEEHHESRASRMLGKVKAKAKKLKNMLTKHGNEHDQDVVDEEEDDESEADEPEKHVAPVIEVSNASENRTSMSHLPKTNVHMPEEIIPSGTNDSLAECSSDYTGGVVPEHEAPSYPVRTSDVSDREDSRETHHAPLNTPVSLFSAKTEDVGEDGLLGGQREVNTDMPKRLEDDLSGESTYQSKIPYHTQQGSEEANQKTGLGTGLESESGNRKDPPVRFGGESETKLGKNLPTINFESEIDNDSPTVFGGKPETWLRDDFKGKSHEFDQKMESKVGKLGTEMREDFQVKSHEFEQTIGSGIGKDSGSGKPRTELREDFLGKSYEFDQEIDSLVRKDSPTRLGGDEKFSARSDDMKVETETETDGHFSPEFSQAEETRYETQELKPTTYTEMTGSATSFVADKAIATKNVVASSLDNSRKIAGGKYENHVGVETVAEKLSTNDETASPVTTKLPLFGGGSEVDETEQGENKGVPTRDHPKEKLTPEEEDKAYSDMVAEKLNLGGEKETTSIKEEVAVEKIPSDKLQEEIEGGEANEEEGKGGGIVGTIKGVYNYWLGATEEMKPKSPNSVEESSEPLRSTVDSGDSGLGETCGCTEAVQVQKGI